MMATKGYLVVMPDYPGIGADHGPHPYMHRALGSSVRDIVDRAAALVATDTDWSTRVTWNGEIYLIGYSEGGYATMVGARALQDNPVDGGTVVAAVPCDGAYDLSGTMIPRILTPVAEPSPYYVPYMIVGYNAVYGPSSAFGFSRVLAHPYDSDLPELFDGAHGSVEINAAMPADRFPKSALTQVAIDDLGNSSSDLYLKLHASDAYRGWTPDMKIQMIHCPTDDVVPVDNAVNAFGAFNDPEHVPAVISVDPITISSDPTAEVHVRAFPTAILAGFGIICSP
ncbi:MAG: hypothetical protein NT080_00035 [Spirochaetes bacterium]|nr:hypothetical protein [Spirochaetota bacterium]